MENTSPTTCRLIANHNGESWSFEIPLDFYTTELPVEVIVNCRATPLHALEQLGKTLRTEFNITQ